MIKNIITYISIVICTLVLTYFGHSFYHKVTDFKTLLSTDEFLSSESKTGQLYVVYGYLVKKSGGYRLYRSPEHSKFHGGYSFISQVVVW